jgi:hypothetical protein
MIKLSTKSLQAFGYGAHAEVWAAVNHNARGLTLSVRVDNMDWPTKFHKK